MNRSHPRVRQAGAGILLALALVPAVALDHPSVKRAFNLPPSADLTYAIKARQKGFSLSGEATVGWRVVDGKYSIVADTRAALLGSILENRSEGAIDSFGLAPLQFYEKRFRRDPATTTFARDGKTITFSESSESYPLKGGEQDRTSVSWQLTALARAAPEKFIAGSEWKFFVAGRRDAEPWIFKVVNQENVGTALGEVNALHLIKMPPPDSKDQQVDIWLAPALEWYAVRVRFTDNDGEFVDQTLEKIAKK